jgi:ABC-type spermidine/putrescine transport system permease subunit I
MDPKFTCPWCEREIRYESEPDNWSVTFEGKIYFRRIDEAVWIADTFCSLVCLFAYIRAWYEAR